MTAVPEEVPRDPFGVRLVQASSLHMTAEQQRDIDPRAVNRMDEGWDWRLAEVAVVATIRETRRLTVVGHQHTIAAAKQRHGDDVLVWVRDLGTLSAREAAEIGVTMNVSPRRPNSVSRWQSRVKFEDPWAVLVTGTLDDVGVTVSPYLSATSMTCAAYLSKLGNRPGQPDVFAYHLLVAVEALMMAYPAGSEASEKRFLGDLVRACTEFSIFNERIPADRLASRSLRDHDPAMLVAHAKAPSGDPTWASLGKVLVANFNRRLRNEEGKATWVEH
jgi:hypothetical protein